MTRDEIYNEIVGILVDFLELDAADIAPGSDLYEGLGLDSIDAVDVFVQLRDVTGRRPDPKEAKAVRTVDDLIAFVQRELERAERGEPEPNATPPDPVGGVDG